MSASKIEVKNLTKIFGDQPQEALTYLENGMGKEKILEKTGMTVGVNQASFAVKSGETFVIMGLSGSGKSTLIRLINRLIEPTSGEVFIDGESITKMDSNQLIEIRRKKLAMVFQNFGLFPHRTVMSNVAYGLEVQGVDKEKREKIAKEVIKEVGLEGYEYSYPNELSGGMQQRVGIARTLANNTDILLMDEAFSALDPIIRKEMQDELIDLQKRMKKTVLFITHDIDEALRLGDRIAIMKNGEIVQIGTPTEILENPINDYVADFVQDVDRAKVLTARHIMKEPKVLLNDDEKLKVAIEKMEKSNIDYAFVTDENDNFKGVITKDDVVKIDSNESRLTDISLKQVQTIKLSQSLNQLLEDVISKNIPIPVVQEGKLIGVVSKNCILSGLVLGKNKDEEEIQL